MTWFRREKDVEWFEGFGDDPAIVRRASTWLAGRLQDSKRKLRFNAEFGKGEST